MIKGLQNHKLQQQKHQRRRTQEYIIVWNNDHNVRPLYVQKEAREIDVSCYKFLFKSWVQVVFMHRMKPVPKRSFKRRIAEYVSGCMYTHTCARGGGGGGCSQACTSIGLKSTEISEGKCFSYQHSSSIVRLEPAIYMQFHAYNILYQKRVTSVARRICGECYFVDNQMLQFQHSLSSATL
jgi:hypothetical protein